MREREIVIRLRLPETLRTRWLLGGAAAVVLFGTIAYATVMLPATFGSHMIVTANDLNANFNYVATTVNGILVSPNPTVSGQALVYDGSKYTPTPVVTASSTGHVSMAATTAGDAVTISTGTSQSGDDLIISGPDSHQLRIAPSAGFETFNALVQTGDNVIAYSGATGGTGSGSLSIVPWANGPSGLRMTGAGNVTITGNLTVTGTFSNPSDSRLKMDIRPIEHPLDTLDELHGVRFRWKRNGEPGLGLIAQDVERVFPELVVRDEKGFLSIAYGNLIGVVVEALKESRADEAQQLRALRAENAALAARLERLEGRLAGADAPKKNRASLALSR